MEENTSTMDSLLEGHLPPADLLSGIPKDANGTMELALGHYQNIINLADKKDIRSDTRAAFRENAMALLSLLVAQSIKMAQLEGRVCELEKSKAEVSNHQQKALINETLAMAKPSFAAVTKNRIQSEKKSVRIEKPTTPTIRRKFLTTIKPVEKDSNSLNTKKVVQNSINIRKIKVAIKNVRHINNGGILIETDNEKDLDTLIEEFKKKDELVQKFTIAKPVARKPHIICFNVSSETGEVELADSLKNQFLEEDEEVEDAFTIKHHFETKRGINWIIEFNPTIYARVVSDEISNSDHNLLEVTWYTKHQTIPTNGTIHISNSNWLFIKKSIFQIINNHANKTISDPNHFIEHLQQELITKCTNTSYPTRSRRKNAVWWTLELKVKRSRTRALRRLYQKEVDDEVRNSKRAAFKKNQAEYKKLIIKTKRNKFKDFINNITTNNCFGKNYQILTYKKKRAQISNKITKDDGSFSESITDSISAILKYHFPLCGEASALTIPFSTDSNFLEISSGELEAVIHKIKYKKAAGLDGIPGEIVKEIYYANPEWFRSILNILLSQGIFPACWKRARIALIPKDNRQLNHPKDFRPICILPCWGKVFDKILAERLTFLLEENNILHQSQFGFRKKRSTINALQSIKDCIMAANSQNLVTCLISIYIENAFNSANWPILMTKIDRLPIPGYLKNILFCFLNDRNVSLGGVEQAYNQGVPQGSCLGPILWNIYFNDILDLDLGQDAQVQAFADDLMIILKAPATYHFTTKCIIPLKNIYSWISDNKLKINSNKSTFTIVSSKNYSHIPNIKMGNYKIKYCKEIKYLGITMDRRLTWNNHLDHVGDKLNNIMHKLNRITRVYWGLTPSVKKEIYKKVLEKIICYGSEIWFKDQEKQNKKLNSLQRVGLLNITKCYRTVCTEALQILAGIPPISITLRFLTKLYHLRYLQQDITIHNQVFNFGQLEPRPDPDPPWNKRSFAWRHLKPVEDGRCIYTDGSKLNGKVGCAMAVQNVNNDYPPIKKIKALIANSATKFELIWTRAHIGVVGNEIADSYAKEATDKDEVDFHLNATINFIKKAAHKAIIAEWQQQWSNSSKGRPVHELFPLVNTKRIHGNYFINQILTGHGAIAIHQHKFFGATSDCNCGAQTDWLVLLWLNSTGPLDFGLCPEFVPGLLVLMIGVAVVTPLIIFVCPPREAGRALSRLPYWEYQFLFVTFLCCFSRITHSTCFVCECSVKFLVCFVLINGVQSTSTFGGGASTETCAWTPAGGSLVL
ncbi:RNA-directed DNA polymerase from mobile element jockey [Caerostris darwini]|uniref:RNA-directed DNA polymerase from mobile element jockey n=1 Tax=Caerostris darwini TaxID=1538125 RepID=A0AAV4STQ4_9ARAC|nr:RNA-directed DNA polymerase from mobile element jockey [Caerostris darwini]